MNLLKLTKLTKLTILILIYSISAYSQNNDCVNSLIGEWELYEKTALFRNPTSYKKTIWSFRENSALTRSNNKNVIWNVDENCEILMISNETRDSNFNILKLDEEHLLLERKFLPHEGTYYKLRKIKTR